MYTLHLISHTHWDREWYLTYQQFRLKLVHLVDDLLDILDTDEQYRCFTLDGQTIILDDYLEIRPERRADLRHYVQEGRILIGPWYVQPDEFLVSPESIIRNLLEGKRTAEQFGARMMVGYSPDPFGHIGQMPQILQGFGIHTACLWRGVQDQPNELWWQSPDGSRVLLAYLRQGYGNAAGILGGGQESFVTEARHLRDQLAPHSAGDHLLLMHGVDHQEAQPGTSAAVAYAAGRLDGDRLVHSNLPAYFDGLQASLDLGKLPTVAGELRSPKHIPLLPGVLSSRMWIKQQNRACENLLEKWAEPFSTWAQAYGNGELLAEALRQPQAVLHQAWRLLMQCHPHDSICGCSIDQVYDEMRPRFDQVEQIGEEITRQSLKALAGAVDSRPPAGLDPSGITSSVVVFNPSTGPRSDAVRATIEALPEGGAFDLLDEDGVPVPYQTLDQGGSALVNMKMGRKEFLDIFNMISPGINMGGGKLMDMRPERVGDDLVIEFQLSPTGEPDLVRWNSSRQQVLALLEDPSIVNCDLRARSDASSQVLFSARDVPGYGYRTFWVRGKALPPQEALRLNPLVRAVMPLVARLSANPTVQRLLQRLQPDPAGKPPYKIENEFFAIEALSDGSLEVLDKRSGTKYTRQNHFVDGGDRGDEYNYSTPEADRLVLPRLKSVHKAQGTVQQTLQISLELAVPISLEDDGKSRSQKTAALPILTQVTLTRGVPRVEFHTEIDNPAQDHRLRVHFPAPFGVEQADYDGHFEVVRRPTSRTSFDDSWAEQPRPEVPQRAFTAISDGDNGLLVANRGLPEVEVLRSEDSNSEIALTLLRCVAWLSREGFPERKSPAGPTLPTPGAQLPGKWAFDYAIVPFHENDRLEAYLQAYAFQVPLRAVSVPTQAGSLPASGSFVQVIPAVPAVANSPATEFAVSAIKSAEDGRGWLLRGYNLADRPVTISVKPLHAVSFVERLDLAEQPLERLAPAPNGGVSLEVRPHEVVTILFGSKV